jgi:fibronectin type 3 domain-containing protein
MFEHLPKLVAFRSFTAATCLAVLAGCGAGANVVGSSTSSGSGTPGSTTEVPAAPASLKAMPGNAQASLTWAASSSAASYQVKRSTTNGGPYAQLVSAMSPSYTDATVTNGATYYYVVTAVNSAGESAESPQASVTPDPTITTPSVPMGVAATAGNAQVSLKWSASSSASSYPVKRATVSGGPYTQIGAPTSTTYIDSALANGTTYYYVVSALDSAGESANSAQVSALPVAPASIPAAPTGLAATSGNARVSLSWSPSSSATSYHVKRATTNGGPYSQLAAPASGTYSDTSVTNDTQYYYVVSALDSAGESANSAQVSALPAALPAAPPTGLPSGPGFNFTSAPTLSGVTMVQNRDSVIIQVPAVAHARDFRVLVQPTGVAANGNGTESVSGGTQFCAGVRQHQSRTHFVADNVSLYPYYFFTNAGLDGPTNEAPPQFFGDGPPTPWSWFDLDTPPLQVIEVTGVTANMTVTVEALDRLCPFPGAIGRLHEDITLSHGPDVTHPDNPWINASAITTFPVVTSAEVAAKYGSLIINGQGWAGGPNVQANPPVAPPFAQPAPLNPPIVLARAAITISPLATPPPALAGFFDDFSNPNDTFQPLPQPKWTYPRYQGAGQLIMQNSKWTFYGNGFTCCTPTAGFTGVGYADAYVENGALHTTLGDWSQDVLSEVTMVPRKAAHINASSYLHVTYEVNSFATNRRYWVVTLCGSSVAGQTLDSTGALKEQVVHTTFFYEPTGMSPSTAGWNCLQIFNRYGNSYAFSQWEQMHNLDGTRPQGPPNKGLYDLADYISNSIPSITDPTKIAAYTVHPESDVVVLVNKPIPKANLPEIAGVNEQVVQSAATSPVNVSPLQLDNPAGEVAWFYKVDANGKPIAPILDDQQLVSPRTKYDLYIRNNRIIMYVNGKAALCNDFTTPTTTLNMAEAAVGFHQVLYHSSGEFVERFSGPDQGAAYHYRYNTPWLDQRTWDNMGFEENVAAPGDFDPQTCFAHASLGPENNEP